MSQAAVFDYFCKLKVGDFIYYESKDDDDNGQDYYGLGEIAELWVFYTKWNINSVTVCSVARHPFLCYS